MTSKRELSCNARRTATLISGCWEMLGILCLIPVAAVVSPAQGVPQAVGAIKFTTRYSFSDTDGLNPYAAVIQATDGNLYGTTDGGGAQSLGTIFKISVGGSLTTLHSFSGNDGLGPETALTQALDGNFYGTTFGGGNSSLCLTEGGCGTVFKMTSSGLLTTLYNFCSQTSCMDGANPSTGLTQGTDGSFYGATYFGGSDGLGTVFKITPAGALTTLDSFSFSEGAGPNSLIQAADGNFYGTAGGGGANAYGTIFKITRGGTLLTLHSFDSTDGSGPDSLIEAPDGNFFGTASEGGTSTACFPGCGTVFAVTSSGSVTVLHSFDLSDGSGPNSLVQATDGNFYGATIGGGSSQFYGTLFKITPSGALTTLHNFTGADGELPFAGPLQDTNGDFYGTTSAGGNLSCNFGAGCGTIYAFSVGLGAFVEASPPSGTVGAPIRILGTDLTGATGVSFNGTAAVFKVVSRTLISATVPTGATTGFVTVTTPSGTLKSNVKFQVRP